MNILMFAALFIFISLLLLLIGGLVFFKEDSKKCMAAAGIFVLLISAGIAGFSYKTMQDVETKEKAAQEERIKKREARLKQEKEAKLAAEEAKRKAEQEKIKAAEAKKKQEPGNKSKKEKEPKAEEPVKKQNYEERRKIHEWNELGRALGEIEAEMQREIGKIDEQIKQLGIDYKKEKVDSYEKLKKQAELNLKKQELILKAQDDKQALLDGAVLLSNDEKRLDLALLEKRRTKAKEAKAKCLEVLQQVEENKGTFKSM